MESCVYIFGFLFKKRSDLEIRSKLVPPLYHQMVYCTIDERTKSSAAAAVWKKGSQIVMLLQWIIERRANKRHKIHQGCQIGPRHFIANVARQFIKMVWLVGTRDKEVSGEFCHKSLVSHSFFPPLFISLPWAKRSFLPRIKDHVNTVNFCIHFGSYFYHDIARQGRI